LTGACERIFKSPIPLVYTRHTARFLTVFCTLLPFGLWGPMDGSWNHWLTIPIAYGIAFFLFGVEEMGIQIEEPFSILPIEAFCNGAIAATMEEMVLNMDEGEYEFEGATTGRSTPTISAKPAAAPELALVGSAAPVASKAVDAPVEYDGGKEPEDWWKSFVPPS